MIPEIQGQLVGAKRSTLGKGQSGKVFQERQNEPMGNESLQTISKRLCKCWLLVEKKNPVYYSAHSANSKLRVIFVCSNTAVGSPIVLF